MKLILAVTAASGAVYARQTAERLAALDCVESVALVYSDVAPTVMAHEGVAPVSYTHLTLPTTPYV